MQKTRAAVVEAADQLFNDSGYDETSIRGIAAEAGVSIGTVMAVGSKDDLLVATFTDRILEASQQNADNSAGLTRLPPTDRLTLIVGRYLTMLTDGGDLTRAWGAALLRRDRYSSTLRQLHESFVAEVSASVDGITSSADAERFAEDLYIHYLGYLFAWGAGLRSAAEILEEMGSDIARLLPWKEENDH